VNFGSLTGKTLLGPEVVILSHSFPEETGANEAASGPDTGMTQGMKMVKNLLSEGLRHKRTEGGSGDIAKEWKGRGKRNSGNFKGGKHPKVSSGWAMLLGCREVLVRKRKKKKRWEQL
jgi:hypothetical protein